MMTLALHIASFVVAVLIGSLPLGNLVVKRLAGMEPREADPQLIGVENLYRLVGAPVATVAFLLDMLKGIAAVVLMRGDPVAAVGVYVGHLYPVLFSRDGRASRGRGNGVLLGVLAGLAAAGQGPWWALWAGVVAYAAVLGWRGFVAEATAVGLAILTLASAVAVVLGRADVMLAWATLALAVVGAWRLRTALARIKDGTEVRLGEPPAIRGLDPNVVLCAFLVHPLTLDDLWQPPSQRWLRRLATHNLVPEPMLRRLLLWFRPQAQGVIDGIELPDGRRMRVLLIAGSMLPDQIRSYPLLAERMAVRGARLAHELGAEAVGLGAFWSTVGDKGARIQEAVPEIAITNGGAYTAATVRAAVPGLLRRFEAQGGSLRRSTAAVVGANGVVAFGVARMIVPEVRSLILVGRDPVRLERSAETLRRKTPGTEILTTTDVDAVAAADLVFTATSDPDPVLYPEHVKPGAWIFDLGRPADVHESVRQVLGVHLVPGGVVRPPGAMRTEIDIRFGDGYLPACLAETMIMTATHAFDRRSLGPVTRTADIEFYLQEGERLGFEIITRDEQVAELEAAP